MNLKLGNGSNSTLKEGPKILEFRSFINKGGFKMSILIDALIKENLITKEQLQDARDKQMGAKKPIQELLIEMGFIKEEDLIKISSKIFKRPVIKLDEKSIDISALSCSK